MKKIYLAIFAMTVMLFSCSNDDIKITTTPKIRNLSYVVNTQSMYDELGITSEVISNYLSKNYNVGVYTFVYDSDENLVEKKSFNESSFGTPTETFQFGEGTYTIVTYETLVGNGYTPSWSGEEKLSTLVFEDNSSKDYHYTLGTVETKVELTGGDKTENVSPAATKVLLTYNINTQSVYDEFEVTTNITNDYLRDKTAAVGLFSYIYNSVGDLVDSVATQQFTLNTTSQIRSLTKGNYTIVTIETLVDPENDNQSDGWSIKDTEKLSTLKISQEYPYIGYASVVGVCTTTTSISGNTALTAIPKAIGSIVRFHCYNIEGSPFFYVGFGTSDILDYYSINPQLLREDKFVDNLSQSGKFNLRGYLSTEKISAGWINVLYIVESNITPKYAAQNEQQAGTSRWTIWEADKESLEDGKTYDAGFYYLYSDDTYSYARKYFGNAMGLASWKAECDKYVKSLNGNLLYEEPFTEWGGTVDAVKAFMSDYVPYNNGNIKEENGQYVLTYAGKYEEYQIRYWFTSETGGLNYSVVFFDSEKVGEDDLYRAFDEMGYSFVMSGDGYSYYKTKDNKSYVYVSMNNQNYWFVRYSDASSTSAPSRVMKQDLPTVAPKQQNGMTSKKIEKANVVKALRQCEDSMKFYFK